MCTIYVLGCLEGKYYVGKTNNITFRLEEHFNSNGSEWTKIYQPYKVEELYFNCDTYDEDKYTIKYMAKYGINNVRGGSFTKINLTNEELEIICKMIKGAENQCYLCGKNTHFIKECPDKNNFDLSFLIKIINDISKIVKPLPCNGPKYKKITVQKSDKDCCYKCGRQGHWAQDCYAKTNINKKKIVDSDSDSDSDEEICYNCGKKGHYANTCYKKKYKKKFKY